MRTSTQYRHPFTPAQHSRLAATMLGAVCLAALLTASAAHATPGSAWLESAPGGRSAALGEAMTASVEGATANYWNPAAVGFGGNALEAMYADSWIQGGSTQYAGAGFDLGRIGLGVSAHFVGVGDIDLRDNPSASPIGTYDARNLAIGGAVSADLWRGWRAGLGVRWLSEQIYVYDAYGWAFDLGLLRTGLFDGALDVGMAARHLGEIGALRVEQAELPMTVSAGAAWHVLRELSLRPVLMADVAQVSGHGTSVRVGAEGRVFDLLVLRAGYLTGREARGFSAGFGLEYDGWRVDFAWVPYTDDLGNELRYSVGARW